MKRLSGVVTLLLFAITTSWAVLQTPPSSLTINPPNLVTDDATYSFQIILDSHTVVQGIPQFRMRINITRSPQGQVMTSRDVVQFGAIILTVMQDASSARIKADGKEFVIEANYPDPFDKNTEPRQVATTFAEMFTGGRVGVTVRLAN